MNLTELILIISLSKVRKESSVVTSMAFMDPEIFASVIRGANFTPCQLSNRPSSSTVIRVQCPPICLDLVQAGPKMLYAGEMPRDCYTLSFVMACPGTGRSFNFGLDFEDGQMGFFPPGTILDATNPAGCVNAILTVPVEEFHSALAIHYPDIPNRILAQGAGLKIGTAEQVHLRGLLGLISSRATIGEQEPSSKLSCHELVRGLLPAFVAALRSGCRAKPLRTTMRVSNRHQRLRQAREFIEGHLHEPIHLEDLCSTLDLSERGLENLFNDLVGIGPTVFLRHQRLHFAHRELQQMEPASGKVKQAALEAGFWHLGHFSQNYRQLFGEKPSETLARTS